MGLTDDWADKMSGQEFLARNAKSTFEHYLQVSLSHHPSAGAQHPLSQFVGWKALTQSC